MFVDDGDGEVEVIPKTVSVISEWVNVFSAVGIELGLGVDLN